MPVSDETKIFRPPPDLIQAASRRKAKKAEDARRAQREQFDDQATQLRQVPKELIYEARRTRARALGHRAGKLPTADASDDPPLADDPSSSAVPATDSSPPNLTPPEQMEPEDGEVTKASRRKLDPSFDAQTIYVAHDLAGSRSFRAKLLFLCLVILLSVGGFVALQFGLGTGFFG